MTLVFRLAALIFLCALAVSGCGSSGASTPKTIDDSLDNKPMLNIDPDIGKKIASRGLSLENMSFFIYSPDSQFIAITLDSTIIFDSKDPMWSADLPLDLYGVRSRKMLFLYFPEEDSLLKIAECDEIVNFYRKQDSLPVMGERKEDFGIVLWSPDSKKLLLLKDRISEGVSSQDALIYTMGVKDPDFLDMMTTWEELMKKAPQAKGTKVKNMSWDSDNRIKLILMLDGSDATAGKELVYDSRSGLLLSAKDL